MLRALKRLETAGAKLISGDVNQHLQRQRHYWKNMDCVDLLPPDAVRGMKVLDRELFKKLVSIPCLRVQKSKSQLVLPLLKKVKLKMEHLLPCRPLLSPNATNSEIEYNEVLLHPLPVKDWKSLPTAELEKFDVSDSDFYFNEVELNYNNWQAGEILKSVLPVETDGLTSWSIIGHIVHINLREHLLPYKKLIGQVILDKVPGCRTVVNKIGIIENTYRNFQLELVCGEPKYDVEVKSNGVTFQLDFSKVYWNPRLGTEHNNIVTCLGRKGIIYDVFAGIGPFSIPAARNGCYVLANDLNPDSFKWLKHNANRNKCKGVLKTFNKDGRDFILEDVKADLLQRWAEQSLDDIPESKISILMNLPAMAVEFLSAFRGLFLDEAHKLDFDAVNFNYPLVHVYLFAKGRDADKEVREVVERHLGLPLKSNFAGIRFIRNVSTNKHMYCLAFSLTKEILTTPIQHCSRKRASTVKHDDYVENAKIKFE